MLETVAETMSSEKAIKGIQTEQEVKLSILSDDMWLSLKDPKNSTTSRNNWQCQ